LHNVQNSSHGLVCFSLLLFNEEVTNYSFHECDFGETLFCCYDVRVKTEVPMAFS